MKAITVFANPKKFEALSQCIAPIAFWTFLVLSAIGLFFALFQSPADYQQGDSVRIMYVHVPAAWLSQFAFVFIAMMSLVAYVWRHPVADIVARSAAMPGAVFTALTIFTGAVWGKPTWGAPWVWDPRLTSVLILLFIYIGYIAVWRSIADTERAARFARLVALVGVINVPIIKFSVDWWNSLHQPASIIRADGPAMHASMLTPLVLMWLAYTAFFVWSVLTGARSLLLFNQVERRSRHAPRTAKITAFNAEASS
ncbi:MAG: heme ABC transporter permease [Pseudomonadota bacterium]